MRTTRWSHEAAADGQLTTLCADALEIGFLVVEFDGGGDGVGLPWPLVERWTRSRAATAALVDGRLASPALEVALCADLVYLRPTAVLELSAVPGPPAAGVIWALGRAGRAALARGLLEPDAVPAAEAVALGLAHSIVPHGAPPPLPGGVSTGALTAARDLGRAAARGAAGLALESASFRLVFAAGDPGEGARAFLGRREPQFEKELA